MNFLNPLFLIGLAAAALPIVIHLINRRRAVRRRFPALEFLRRSQKRLARRLKVRHIALLALRVAGLLILVLALAKPYLVSEAGTTDAERMPRAVVFVVDDSASMAYGDGAVWRKAVETVNDEVERLRTWDRVSLVYASAWPAGAPLGEDVPIAELVDDHSEVTEALDNHAPSRRATDVAAAIRSAAAMLAGSDMPNRQIVLVTDRQKTGLSDKDLAALNLSVPVEIVDVRAGEEEPNLAIEAADYHQQSAGARPEFEISATVHNYGSADKKGVELRLVVDGEHAASSLIDVPAGKSTTRSFTYQFERKGLHRARFELGTGADPHPTDNVYYFPVHLASKVRALLVNGDRRSVAYQDELFYLERALQPGPRSSSSIIFETVGVDGLAGRPFTDYDVVLLANVEKLPRASVVALRQFVEGGGGLLFVAGDKVRPETWNGLFDELLPKPLRSVKLLAEPDDPDAPVKLTRIGHMDRSHPVFKVFDLPGGESIHSVRVYSYLLLEPTTGSEAKTVLTYGDGAPALLEKPLGAGRVAMLTTTIDRDWTDLPIRTAYLPLMRRYLRYLARRGTSSTDSNHFVAHKVSLELPPDQHGRVEVRDPDGGRIVLAPESTEEGAPLSFVPRTSGHYTVRLTPDYGSGPGEEIDELAFAVNIDPKESDLTPMPTDELEGLLTPGAGGEGGEGGATLDTPERRVGVWGILLFLVTLVLLAETILGTRRSVLLKLWNKVRGREMDAEERLREAVK